MSKPTKLSLYYCGSVDLAKSKRTYRKIRDLLFDAVERFPQRAEGVITLGGVEHWYVYEVVDDFIEATFLRRDDAEEILNEFNLSTHEPWSPWQDRSVRIEQTTKQDRAKGGETLPRCQLGKVPDCDFQHRGTPRW